MVVAVVVVVSQVTSIALLSTILSGVPYPLCAGKARARLPRALLLLLLYYVTYIYIYIYMSQKRDIYMYINTYIYIYVDDLRQIEQLRTTH